MKLRLLFLLSVLCFLPAMGHAQTAGGVQSINGVPGPYTFGSGATCTGTTCTFSGGGGSLPSAAVGQFLTNTTGSTTYAGQSNIFYQQTGDTIASIETACSSPCTYVVTNPQTITLAASHAMNSNVWLDFEANGVWTVNGSTFVLSNVQVAPSSTVTGHFALAGSATVTLSLKNAIVPVEWFGAVAGGTASTNLTAMQACINAITSATCWLSGAYSIAGTISITKGNVGFQGPPVAQRGGNTGSYLVGLTETIAGDDAIDVHGTSGNLIPFNQFKNFYIISNIAQTGTAAGLSLSFAGGAVVDGLFVQDFFYPIYAHSAPSYGGGGIINTTTAWTSLSSAMVSPIGYYLDSTDGSPENSIVLTNDAAACISSGGPTGQVGMELNGSAVNDVDTNGFASSNCSYGQVVNYTGGGSNIASNDIHFYGSTNDGVRISCIKISNLALASDGYLEVNGGHCDTIASTGKLIDIESSFGVKIEGVSISQVVGTTPATAFIYAASSSNLVISNNILTNFSSSTGEAFEFTGTSYAAVTGNVIYASTGNVGNILWLTGNSTHNSITGNNISGYSTAGSGITMDAGSNNNNCCATNAIDITHITSGFAFNDAGTSNGMQVSQNGPFNINNASAATSFMVSASIYAPNMATTDQTYIQMGKDSASNYDLADWAFVFVGAASTSNHGCFTLSFVSGCSLAYYPNLGVEIGETTAAAPSANGLAVGTTGQFTVSGAGATTAPEFLNTSMFSLGTCTTAKTIDPANGNHQVMTLTNADACALTFTQPASGVGTVTVKVIQSAVSTFNGTISGCKWPGAVTPTITATTGAVDFFTVYLDGTNAYCVASQDFR